MMQSTAVNQLQRKMGFTGKEENGGPGQINVASTLAIIQRMGLTQEARNTCDLKMIFFGKGTLEKKEFKKLSEQLGQILKCVKRFCMGGSLMDSPPHEMSFLPEQCRLISVNYRDH
jgi:hypothetical protein